MVPGLFDMAVALAQMCFVAPDRATPLAGFRPAATNVIRAWEPRFPR
jgi:hypothetical protein